MYLTENTRDHDEATAKRAALHEFISDGFLTFSVDPKPQAQMRVYRQCIRKYRSKHNWLAFFDADEFLVLRDGCASHVGRVHSTPLNEL